MIITIDGPSGTGKSTVAKRVAEKLGMTYFDTGAMYRAVTWLFLKNGIDLENPEQMAKHLETFEYLIRQIDDTSHYFVGEEDVTDIIRSKEVNAAVSAVAAKEIVRKKVWAIQRANAEKVSAVFEGRDMGSVVFPKAEVKIFLDANPEIRAKRRLDEMRKKWPIEAEGFDASKMEEELKRRDTYDSTRKLAPLKCPKGAVKIDTSDLTIDEVVNQIVAVQQKTIKELVPSWLHSKVMHPFYRFTLCVAWGVFRLLYRHQIYGLEHYIKRAAIIAPNHTSYWDPPLVAVSWPEEVHFLAREGLFRNPVFGAFIRKMNSHPVSGDVGDVSVFKTIIELLKEGKQLVLFPEGGRTEGELGEIKPGIGMLVMRSNAVIVPTYIHGASRIWGRKKKFPKLFGKTAVVFGTPIAWESFSHLEKKEAQIAIADALHTSILKLKEWYDSGQIGIPP